MAASIPKPRTRCYSAGEIFRTYGRPEHRRVRQDFCPPKIARRIFHPDFPLGILTGHRILLDIDSWSTAAATTLRVISVCVGSRGERGGQRCAGHIRSRKLRSTGFQGAISPRLLARSFCRQLTTSPAHAATPRYFPTSKKAAEMGWTSSSLSCSALCVCRLRLSTSMDATKSATKTTASDC